MVLHASSSQNQRATHLLALGPLLVREYRRQRRRPGRLGAVCRAALPLRLNSPQRLAAGRRREAAGGEAPAIVGVCAGVDVSLAGSYITQLQPTRSSCDHAAACKHAQLAKSTRVCLLNTPVVLHTQAAVVLPALPTISDTTAMQATVAGCCSATHKHFLKRRTCRASCPGRGRPPRPPPASGGSAPWRCGLGVVSN